MFSEKILLSPAKEAIEIVNTEHVHLELNVFEKDIQNVKEGQKIRFRLPNSENESHEAEVYLVGKKVTSENRTVGIHGHIHEDTPNTFLPGMYIEARIEIDSKKANVLPEQALVNVGNKYYALVLLDKTEDQYSFKKIEIQIGKIQNGKIEILNASGITSTDSILTKGAFNMIN